MIQQIEAQFLTLAILRMISILPCLTYYRRSKDVRFVYMMMGWFLWGLSPICHLFEPIHWIFTLLYGIFVLSGTYLVTAGVFQEFSMINFKKFNIGLIILILPFFMVYFVFPNQFFKILEILQGILIQAPIFYGILYRKRIIKNGGNHSFILFIFLSFVSECQILMVILIPGFINTYYSFGIIFLIIFLINFFIVLVEQNIILLQIQYNTQELEKNEHRFRGLVESTSDLIWEMGKDGSYSYLSSKIYDLLGFQPEEILGKNVPFTLIPKEKKRVGEFIEELYHSKKPFKNYENIHLHKDGRKIILETSGVPIFDEQDVLVGYRGICRDITEYNYIQEKLHQGQKMEAIGRFAGGIAHDFNNLLTVIIGLSDQMIEEYDELKSIIQQKNLINSYDAHDDDRHENLTEINKAGKRAANLTSQLLAFSRKQILNPKVINVNDIIKNMNQLLKRLVSEDISFILRFGGNLSNIKCDPNQFEQVIMNLVLNARDSMPHGGKIIIETSNIEITPEFSIMDIKPGKYIQITVSDSGIGMSSEQQSHLFEPFYTTKKMGKGTGLGLSTVYGIVKQSNGDISVYTHLGKGTSIKVYLPSSSEPLTKLFSPDQSRNEDLHGTETILIVEDEDSLLNFTHKILKSHGYDVIAADNPTRALEIFQQTDKNIQILLTDVIMPDMTGKELSDQLVNINPHLNVIFMSGYTEKAIVERGILIEGVNFLSKPFSSTDLLVKLKEIKNKQ